MNSIAVAQMRINIGEEEFIDSPDLDYADIYRRVAIAPNTRAWVSAPKPDQWLATIKQAASNFDAVICLTVAAGLSASYDSARVAAQQFTTKHRNIDVRVVDSGTISGALKLLAMDMARAVERGSDVEGVLSSIDLSRTTLRTIAALEELNRIHLIANTPRFVINAAQVLNVKPVITFASDEFQLVGKPITFGVAKRRLFSALKSSIGDAPAGFVVLHVDDQERAEAIAAEIRSRFDCQYMNISDFHPFIGLYAGRRAVGIAWQLL